MSDAVKQPDHYKQVPGVECIEVTQHFNFNLGNAIKYIWRCNHKGKVIEDLRKAKQYIEFEIARRERIEETAREKRQADELTRVLNGYVAKKMWYIPDPPRQPQVTQVFYSGATNCTGRSGCCGK